MMRLKWGLPVLLLAVCGMAAAQVAPASGQAPAAGQQTPILHRIQQAATGTAAAPSVSAAPLPPRQQRLLDEADQLVALAQKLKTDVDKTNQDTLSLNTLRRADDVEKLAKDLQKQVEQQDR
ncbi:MAG: hypothetical protein WBW84_05740 [Acidobacteriaceae bacterium]